MSLKSKLREIDKLIREAKGTQARQALQEISKGKIPQGDRITLASLSRRADLPLIGIRLLHPIVRGKKYAAMSGTDAERAEYAACLIRIGASEEAETLLQSTNAKELPQVLLYRAFAYIHQWEYGKALAPLSAYIERDDADHYMKLVAMLNLASALVYEQQHDEASNVLSILREETAKGGHLLLHGNALELSAQNALSQEKWAECDQFLWIAATVLSTMNSMDSFFILKWQAIATLMKNGPTKENLSALAEVRAKAKEWQHWETLRSCDRYEAAATKNAELFAHLYFGTPYRSFLERLRMDMPKEMTLPESYLLYLGKGTPKFEINLLTGSAEGFQTKLKPGELVHRIFILLASDFYRPFFLGYIHYQLYSNTVFDPVTGVPKVREALRRLRDWFTENEIPLEVDATDGLYRLRALAPVCIRVSKVEALNERSLIPIEQLKEHWPEKPFSIQDASKILNMRPRSALRILSKASGEGKISRIGKGPAIRYKFSK